jgi:geranylgeranyl reductase family protein
MRDIVIVGAGPGGLYAARELALAGFDTLVIEEHSDVGRPVHCTGIVGSEAYREYDIPKEAILNELTIAKFVSPSGQTFSYTPERIEAVVVDRAVFDAVLARQATAAGAEMQQGRRATAIRIESDGVTVALGADGAETIRARVCILACGANYSMQRALGLGMPGAYLQSAQVELPASRSGPVELHFGAAVAPKGFAWSVPVRRGPEHHVRVGLMCEGDALAYFSAFVARIAPARGIATGPGAEPRRKILPLAPITRTFTERLVAVGDAAGLVKATTGGGIYYSIVSAAAAAASLSQALHDNNLSESSLARYERGWRDRLGAELEAQQTFRTYAERLTDVEIEDLFHLVNTDGIIPLVRRTASFNHHRALILALLRHAQFRKILLRAVVGL